MNINIRCTFLLSIWFLVPSIHSLHLLKGQVFEHRAAQRQQYGSNFDLGVAIGAKQKQNIRARLSAAGPQLQKAQEYARTVVGRTNLASLTNATNAAFPEYWQEMEGIAHGSETDLQEIILLNFRQELVILAEQGEQPSAMDDCSDVMLEYGNVPGKPVSLLGHNEDNSIDTVGTSYFVFANMSEGGQWAAFTYAGELSTAAWGWNSYGVCFTLNALYANEVNVHGVGRTFVTRSILDSRSLREAIHRLKSVDQATGYNLNIIGLDERRITTVEIGPGSALNTKEIASESYFHANAYLRLETPQSPGPSSIHREERAASLPVPQNRTGILMILGDTEDKEYPIWRSGSDNEFTLVTCLFDVYEETVEIIYGNPSPNQSELGAVLQIRERARGYHFF